MARQRRGFGPPELKGTLGTLLRTTLQQASAVRDVIERGARSRLEDLRHNRRRHDALAELGEIMLDLIQRGEIDLDELPEARTVVEQLLDQAPDEHDHHEVATPPSRSRFDDRPAKKPRDAGDGTVSSAASRWALPKQGQPAPSRVWRPDVAAPPPASVAAPVKKGGISFDDDEDLADYMHPDDVPPKHEP